MPEPKTQKTRKSVVAYIDAIADEQKRADAHTLRKIMARITGKRAALWGTSIIGFDAYHYESERSTQKGSWPIVGFSPRKANISIYIMPGFKRYSTILRRLGKHKHSVSCLYIKRLSDIDLNVLEVLITRAVADMRRKRSRTEIATPGRKTLAPGLRANSKRSVRTETRTS